MWGTAQLNPNYKAGMIHQAPKNLDQVSSLSRRLSSLGLTKLDTAPDYANAERLLGESLAHTDFRLQTKWKLGEGSPERQHSASQARLGSNEIWANLLHDSNRLSSFSNAEEITRQFASWLSLSACRIGFSVYSLEEVRRVLRLGLHGGVLQIPYNILSRELLWSEEVLNLKSMGYVIQVRSLLMRGMLAESNRITKAAELPSVEAARDAVHSVCLEYKLSPGGLLMYDALMQNPVDEVVLGISSSAEVAYLAEVNAVSATYQDAHEHLSDLLRKIRPRAEELNPLNW